MGVIRKAVATLRSSVSLRSTRLLISLLALLTAGTASASLLPVSSYYEGSSYFYRGGRAGHIDFAVYDTLDSDGDEFSAALGDTAPGSGQYIYAYQIFSDNLSSTIIDYFTVFDIGEGAIADFSSDIGTVSDSPGDPGAEGVDATKSYFNPTLTKGVWEFNYDGEHIIAGEHSYFLILRSNQEWTVGHYEFTHPDDDLLAVPDVIPEPFTLTLLGLGSVMLFSRRRNVTS